MIEFHNTTQTIIEGQGRHLVGSPSIELNLFVTVSGDDYSMLETHFERTIHSLINVGHRLLMQELKKDSLQPYFQGILWIGVVDMTDEEISFTKGETEIIPNQYPKVRENSEPINTHEGEGEEQVQPTVKTLGRYNPHLLASRKMSGIVFFSFLITCIILNIIHLIVDRREARRRKIQTAKKCF